MTTVATLPQPPCWATTVTPIEQGREFSAGFGERSSGSIPRFLVEIVQPEIMDAGTDPASILRPEARVFIGGSDYSPGEAGRLAELIQNALDALGAASAAPPSTRSPW